MQELTALRHVTTKTPEYRRVAGTSYRGADKSLARPGMKQARKHIMEVRDFNNIGTRAVINFLFSLARQGAEGN